MGHASDNTAIIIGAGPAGLTAALELLQKTPLKPVVLEMSHDIGGLSKTIDHHGNRIDIGGHRFFSKSPDIMRRWIDILPLQGRPARDYRQCQRTVMVSNRPGAPDPDRVDQVMLVRKRLSRILFRRQLFPYPICLSPAMIKGLGYRRLLRMAASFVKAKCFPLKPERSLADFLTNRFGRELYLTFFKDYTEKVWGVSPHCIGPAWGAQRIKGLSAGRVLAHALQGRRSQDDRPGETPVTHETSLIGQFFYPKYGPGQLWQSMAEAVQERGGQVLLGHRVTQIETDNGQVKAVGVQQEGTGRCYTLRGRYCLSSMPVCDLISALGSPVPSDIRAISAGLPYRDFITVGLLLNRLTLENRTGIRTPNAMVPDNWIYVQQEDVRVGRIQLFNNWSPYMVHDPETVWLGLEYFCTVGDDLWTRPDHHMVAFALAELKKIGFTDSDHALDSVVIRVPKAYPAYFGTYHRFETLRQYVDGIENLFLIGRNGMHRYNNQDHSMLTALAAVTCIVNGTTDKSAIWQVNAEDQYHEETSYEMRAKDSHPGPGPGLGHDLQRP